MARDLTYEDARDAVVGAEVSALDAVYGAFDGPVHDAVESGYQSAVRAEDDAYDAGWQGASDAMVSTEAQVSGAYNGGLTVALGAAGAIEAFAWGSGAEPALAAAGDAQQAVEGAQPCGPVPPLFLPAQCVEWAFGLLP